MNNNTIEQLKELKEKLTNQLESINIKYTNTELVKRNKDELLRYDVYKNVKKKFYYIILSNNTANTFSTIITVLNSFDNEIWNVNRFELMNDCICLGSLNSIEIEKLQQHINK